MKISLSQIKPSPLAVRKTWDEEALEQLAQSIKEQGIIVPIKVRPDGNGKYEIVYGHRRVKAMRLAGIKETDAIVEGMDDTDVLVQALIENIQREEMNQRDTAVALQTIKDERNWNNQELEDHGVISFHRASELLAVLKQTAKVQKLVQDEEVTERHIRSTRSLGNEKDKEAVIEKAAKEGLTSEQTRRVAEAIAAAPSEKAKQQLLEREYTPTVHDPEWIRGRAKKHGAHDPIYRFDDKKSDTDWRQAPEVKAITDAIITWQKLIGEFQKTADAGKMAPEARQFIANRARRVAKELVEWADELESEP